VVGINTAIISRSGGSQGIGFAIPSNTVKMALASLLEKGRIIRGYLGIETAAPPVGQGNAGDGAGVPVVSVVPDSPAAEAKIEKGDIIQKFDGREVKNIAELRRLVSQVELDKKVEVQVTRNGKPVTLAATIKEQPANYQLARALPPDARGRRAPSSPNEPDAEQPDQPDQPDLTQPNGNGGVLDSIEVRELTPQLAQRLGVPRGVRGVVIAQVGAELSGGQLRAGDVIEAVNQAPVTSVEEYEQAIQSLDSSQPQVLSVCRQRSRSFVVVKPR
ncbi:MAG: PDZ domain-containing protein, partial [Chthoniobacterales bacterium]